MFAKVATLDYINVNRLSFSDHVLKVYFLW